MDKKKLLVCGGTGFIGRNLAESFSQNDGYEVYATYHTKPPYKNNKINFLKGDLRIEEDVRRVIYNKNIVVNAAAVTTGFGNYRAERDLLQNVVMNSNVIQEAYNSQIENFIFLSCSIMYPSSNIPLKEEEVDLTKIHPKYYASARMKVFFEDICRCFSQVPENKTKFTVARHSNIYGPYDKFDAEKSHVFGATIGKVMNSSENNTIRIWGKGEEERDLLYVSDLVNFIKLSIESQRGNYELYNVGYGRLTSVNSLVNKIIDISGKNLQLNHDLTKHSIETKISLDCSKALNCLGWSPEVKLEEGIKKTIEWYRENII